MGVAAALFFGVLVFYSKIKELSGDAENGMNKAEVFEIAKKETKLVINLILIVSSILAFLVFIKIIFD
jgi:hypothetical protein